MLEALEVTWDGESRGARIRVDFAAASQRLYCSLPYPRCRRNLKGCLPVPHLARECERNLPPLRAGHRERQRCDRFAFGILADKTVNFGEPVSRFSQSDPSYFTPASRKIRSYRIVA